MIREQYNDRCAVIMFLDIFNNTFNPRFVDYQAEQKGTMGRFE